MGGNADADGGGEEYDFMSGGSQKAEYHTAGGPSQRGHDASNHETHLDPAQTVNGTDFNGSGYFCDSHFNNNSLLPSMGGGGEAGPSRPYALTSHQASDVQFMSHPSSWATDIVEDNTTSQSTGLLDSTAWTSDSGEIQESFPMQFDSGGPGSQWPYQGVDNDALNYELVDFDQYVADGLQYGLPDQVSMDVTDGYQAETFGQIPAVDNVHTTARLGSTQPWNHLTVVDTYQGDPSQDYNPHGPPMHQTFHERTIHGGHLFFSQREESAASNSSNFPASYDLTESTRTLRALTSHNLTEMEQSHPGVEQHASNGIPIVVTAPGTLSAADGDGYRRGHNATSPSMLVNIICNMAQFTDADGQPLSGIPFLA